MMKAAIFVFLCGLFSVGFTTDRCPESHPYVYYNGGYCCNVGKEKYYSDDGSKCDGSDIYRDSLCCAGEAIRCPHGHCESNLGRCPSSHPYVYYNGDYCCDSNREKYYSKQGWKCDGSKLQLGSLCCDGDVIRCASGLCQNHLGCDCNHIAGDVFDLKNIEYDLDNAVRSELPPKVVGKKLIRNRNGSLSQQLKFSLSRTVSETSSFSHTAGASVTVGTTFSVGVPFIADGEISVEVTASYEYTTGKESTEEKTVTADFMCNGAARKVTECDALMFREKIDVPFKRTWVQKEDPTCECTDEGVFNRIAGHRLDLAINEEE